MQSRSLFRCALLLALAFPAISRAQFLHQRTDATTPNSDDTASPAGVEILSDTGGVDVDPYLRQILPKIYRSWAPLIPAEAKPPQSEQGEALIRFTIAPNGQLTAMHLDGSSHNDAINRSCWNAIASTRQFPPLPTGMETRPLEIRIHFYVNRKPHSASATSAPQ